MNWLVKFVVSTAVVALAVIAVIRLAPPLSISSTNTQKTDLFTVSGEGKVSVIPDTGIVNLGITINRGDVKSAQSEVNRVMDKITQDIKKLGIEDKDIKTQNYSIYPQYDYQNGANRITGYHVNSNLVVTVRQLEKINSVIDTATADGANTVGGVTLTVDEARHKQLLQEARDQAVAEAKVKAESLSRSAGITLGRIVNIQESGDRPISPLFLAKEMAADGRGGGADTSISPGSTDISTTVTLFYETR